MRRVTLNIDVRHQDGWVYMTEADWATVCKIIEKDPDNDVRYHRTPSPRRTGRQPTRRTGRQPVVSPKWRSRLIALVGILMLAVITVGALQAAGVIR